jgi:DNA-binding response OmpR family regulator
MLLDITLPVMDGFEAPEALRGTGLKALVIVISADVQWRTQVRAKELGAVACLKRPVKTEEINPYLQNTASCHEDKIAHRRPNRLPAGNRHYLNGSGE